MQWKDFRRRKTGPLPHKIYVTDWLFVFAPILKVRTERKALRNLAHQLPLIIFLFPFL